MLGGLAGSGHASTLSPDLHTLKAAPQNLRGGDFDGDGRADTLYLVNEADSGRVAVHIRLDRVDGPQDMRVTSLEAGAFDPPNLRVVPAGAYAPDCGTYAAGCTSKPIEAAHDSVMLGLDGTTTVLLYWNGSHFEQDFVKSDDTILAHAVAALYAVNP